MKKKVIRPNITVVSLRELLHKTYIAKPIFQREYVWTEDECAQLVSDLTGFASDDSMHNYTLDEIIVYPSEEEHYDYELVDGQQRTSTLVILFSVLYSFIKDTAESTELHGVMDAFHSPVLKTMRVKLADNASDQVLKKFIENPNDDIVTINKSQEYVAAALSSIKEALLDTDHVNDTQSVLDFIETVLDGVYVTLHIEPNKENAMMVFDRKNNRGIRLTSSDKLKNYFLQILQDSGSTDAKMIQFNTDWSTVTHSLYKLNKSWITLDYLLQQIAKGNGVLLQQTAIYTYYTTEYTTEDEVTEFISKLLHKATFLSEIIEGAKTNSELAKYKGTFRQNYPVQLSGSNLNEDAYAFLCRRIDTILGLYWLADHRTNHYTPKTLDWSKELSKLDNTATIDQVLDATKYEQKDLDMLLSLIKAELQKLDYKKDSKKIKAILSLLSIWANEEVGITKETLENLLFSKEYHIDHIYPQSGSGIPNKNTLGNLTLLPGPKNGSAKAMLPQDKADYYRNTSALKLTQALSLKSPDPHEDKFIAPYRIQGVVDHPIAAWNSQNIDNRLKQLSIWLETALLKRMV